MPETEDFYEILRVHPEAPPEDIRASYRRLALRYHPDLNPSPDANRQMARLNIAYEVLRDPVRRRDYTTVPGLQRRVPLGLTRAPARLPVAPECAGVV